MSLKIKVTASVWFYSATNFVSYMKLRFSTNWFVTFFNHPWCVIKKTCCTLRPSRLKWIEPPAPCDGGAHVNPIDRRLGMESFVEKESVNRAVRRRPGDSEHSTKLPRLQRTFCTSHFLIYIIDLVSTIPFISRYRQAIKSAEL